MKLQLTVLVVVVCVLGCGKAEEKEESAECKRAVNTAHRTWGVYLKTLDTEQPNIAGKGAKFAPEEGYADLAAASKEAIEAWGKATQEAKEQATKARFGKRGDDKLEPVQAALDKARTAREKAGHAIEQAFAARLQKGADEIQRDQEAATPKKKGKRPSAKHIKKLEATQARVAKNNGKVRKAKDKLAARADAILDLAKRAVETDEAAVAACAK